MNKKLFWTLWGAGTVATALVMPYLFSLRKEMLAEAPMSPFAIAAIGTAQTAILLAIVVYLGLKAAKSVGLRVPYVESFFAGAFEPARFKRMVIRSAAVGAVVGLLIIGFDLLFSLFVDLDLSTESSVPLGYRLLASFYGGITEELFMRLFLMSGIAWLVARLAKGASRPAVIWTSVVAASVIFGLGHLPVTASLVAITPMVVLRAIVLNGIGGVAFGWLYARRGLESAMVAHFVTDIVIHGIYASLA